MKVWSQKKSNRDKFWLSENPNGFYVFTVNVNRERANREMYVRRMGVRVRECVWQNYIERMIVLMSLYSVSLIL